MSKKSDKPEWLKTASIYDQLRAIDADMSNHESDLYVTKTAQVMDPLHNYNATLLPGQTRLTWSEFDNGKQLELPFQWAPYYTKLHIRKRKEAETRRIDRT